MIDELSHNDRIVQRGPIEFLSAPKRKREDDIAADESSSTSRQHQDADDDHISYPQHKRSNSSTTASAIFSFCTSSCDIERRDGPTPDTDAISLLDDETEALVNKYRTSTRQEVPPSPGLFSTTSSRAHSPFISKEEDKEEDYDIGDLFPTLQRATTICDASDSSTADDGYADPPDMVSRPASPQEEEMMEQRQQYHHQGRHHWSPSSVSELEYHHRHDEDKELTLEARQRPEWLSLSTSSAERIVHQRPSPLWQMSSRKEPSWPASWSSGMFHQGTA